MVAFVLRVHIIMTDFDNNTPQIDQYQSDLMLVSLMLYILIYAGQVLSFSPALGEVFTMVCAMVTESAPVLAWMLIIGTATGIVCHIALPLNEVKMAKEIDGKWPLMPMFMGWVKADRTTLELRSH